MGYAFMSRDHTVTKYKRPIKFVVLIGTTSQIFSWLYCAYGIAWPESITHLWVTYLQLILPYFQLLIKRSSLAVLPLTVLSSSQLLARANHQYCKCNECFTKMVTCSEACSTFAAAVLEYDTSKVVHIKSKKVGAINRLIQLVIIGYVIG